MGLRVKKTSWIETGTVADVLFFPANEWLFTIYMYLFVSLFFDEDAADMDVFLNLIAILKNNIWECHQFWKLHMKLLPWQEVFHRAGVHQGFFRMASIASMILEI